MAIPVVSLNITVALEVNIRMAVAMITINGLVISSLPDTQIMDSMDMEATIKHY